MNNRQIGVSGLFDEAVSLAERVVGLCDAAAELDSASRNAAFQRLRNCIACLPLLAADYCYFENTVADAESQLGGGEANVGRWELVQVLKRLRRFRDDWKGRADARPIPAPTHHTHGDSVRRSPHAQYGQQPT